jgi:hypothetical protein
MSETFIEAVLAGDALWVDADEWVAKWHRGEGPGDLHDYLGMTWDEYRLWTEQPSSLRVIVAAHEADEPVERFLEEADELAIAARGLEPKDRDAVLTWLRKTGRI